MKKAAIVMGGTANMSFAMAVFLLSFFQENLQINTDVIIFHDGISESEKKVMEQIHPCYFREYISPFSMEVLDRIDSICRFTPMVFCKYECLRLLNEYETVVWFDYDMIVTGDLTGLFTPVSGGARLMLTRTLGECIKGDLQGGDLERYKCKIGVHSSVMAFYNTLPDYLKLYDWCIEMTEKYSYNLKLPEQVIFSLMIHQFNIPVYPLQFSLYSPHPILHKGNPWDMYVKIWHTYGKKKFWNGIHNNSWNEFYEEYLKLYNKYKED